MRIAILCGVIFGLVACGSSSGGSTSSGSSGATSGSGGSSGASGSTGGSGSSASSVAAPIAGDNVSFSGNAVAVQMQSTSVNTLEIFINDGAADCASNPQVAQAVGAHDVRLYVIREGATPQAIAAGTYDQSGPSDAHAEAYVEDVAAGTSTTCAANEVAENGGTLPFSVVISSIDSTQVSGTFNITVGDHQNATSTLSGSFSAPICSGSHLSTTCN